MLETNKPFLFNAANNTNNRQNTIEQLTHGKSLHNYYLEEEDKHKYTSGSDKIQYQGKTPIRLNSAFIQHEEYYNNYPRINAYKYKLKEDIFMPSPLIIQREDIPAIRSSEEDDWYEEPIDIDSSDNRKVKKRKEMTHKMERLNHDFIENKDRLYSDKLLSIENELKEAHNDIHTSYLDGLRDLELMRKKTIEDGLLFKEYQKQVTENQFRLEIYQAEEEYTAETHEIREKLFSLLEEKRRKLKEDKDNCDLTYDIVLESQSRLHKRNLRKRRTDTMENKAIKRKQLNDILFYFYYVL